MNDTLPKPPIGPEVDLRDFRFMPLDVVRLRDSDLALTSSAAGFRAAVLLWCAAWHQRPAGSLPNDDRAIARLAGCDASELSEIRDEALHGFTLYGDGRLYHPVVVEKALEAWSEKQKYRDAANKRWKDKKKTKNATHIKRTEDASKTHPKRIEDLNKTYMQETGTGKGKEEVPSSGSKEPSEGRGRADLVDLADPKTQLYARGKEVLGSSAGGQITKLLAMCQGSVPKARAVLEQASIKANPAEYVAGAIRNRRTEEDEAAIRDRNIASGRSL